MEKALNNRMVKYYLRSILRDAKVKNEFINELKSNSKETVDACKSVLPNEEICKKVLSLLAKSLEKKKN